MSFTHPEMLRVASMMVSSVRTSASPGLVVPCGLSKLYNYRATFGTGTIYNVRMIMTKILSFFQRYIVIGLMLLMMVVILVSAIELGIMIVFELLRTPSMQLSVQGALELFGFFFIILIGLELIHTIELYLKEEYLHVEIVFLVAMIAVSRKVIILDYKSTSPLTLFGIAAVILSLAAGYYLVRRTTLRKPRGEEHVEPKQPEDPPQQTD